MDDATVKLSKNGRKNGFAIKSWSDVGIIILIVSFIVSGLVWGMKLEGRADTLVAEQKISHQKLQEDIQAIRLLLAKGILPRADERLSAVERQLVKIDDRDRLMEQRMSQHGINGTTKH